MRWLVYKKDPRNWETRTVTKFLFIPKVLPINHTSGPKEVRWLERVRIRQYRCHFRWFDEWWDDESLT
jgi:hypothetical protein